MRTRLAIRYTLISCCILLIVMLTYSYFHVSKVERLFSETSLQDADQIADLILRNSYHLMLEDNRHHLQLMMEEVGGNPRVQRARILGRAGVVSFSTDPDEIGTLLNEHDTSCSFCHIQGSEVQIDVPLEQRIRALSGRKHMNVTRGIYNEPSCYTAACHAHPPEEQKVGVLDMVVSIDHMTSLSTMLQNDVILSTFVMMLILSMCHYLLTRKYICQPIQDLLEQSQTLSAGDMTARVKKPSEDEMGELGRSFNHMAENLQQAQTELQEWGNTLEQKVVERTAEMAAMQNQLLQSAKLASMGELVAGIAHEINNPLTGILMFASLSAKNPDLPPQVRDNMELIVSETGRCAKIVRGLLEFARESIPEKKSTAINPVIEQTLNLVSHQPLFQDIRIQRRFGENLPELELDADQWQQVFLNMFINAAQAMPAGGTLSLATELLETDKAVRIVIEDTGIGISQEHLNKVFDPFFSTKEQNGFGLGLSVTYGIIKNHGGSVTVQSTEGKGTRFTILLPVEGAQQMDDGQEAAQA